MKLDTRKLDTRKLDTRKLDTRKLDTRKLDTRKNKRNKRKDKKKIIKYDSMRVVCNSDSIIKEDPIGPVCISRNDIWGASTQRAIHYFSISKELMPIEIIYAYAIIKKNAVKANYDIGLLKENKKKDAIIGACNEILNKKYDNAFPLHVWQTGSGSYTNMNVNEVISNIANKLIKNNMKIDPHDDVNRSQSTNDTFGAAIQIAACILLNTKMIPNLLFMINTFKKKQHDFKNMIKIGRTHMEDAVPITFGEEFSGYVSLLEYSMDNIKKALHNLYVLGLGGTAIGIGTNTLKSFGPLICKYISKELKMPFNSAKNKIALMTAHNSILGCSDSLKMLATNIIKISNDIILMNSGPKSGFKELTIHSNEPGSSIMPGKVNPSQLEAAIMASIQVISNNLAISISNAEGKLEMNMCKPLIAYNIIQSLHLLSDICKNMTAYCISTIKINIQQNKDNVDQSLSLVTALTPYIGYDKSAELSNYAFKHNLTIKEANHKMKYVDETKIDGYFDDIKI
jgi:fumarate hydratase class II